MSESFVKEPTQDELKEWLKPIQDPEILMSLVDLGLIYTCDFKEGKVDIKMSLTSPGCPAADYMVSEVKKRVLEYPGVTDATVAIVWEPKWDPKEMASEEAKEKLGIW
ncbi:MAG: DUF59 domain-containing protein [Xanthomonadaceae bacterium]|nr:DUF59 domain-containing protein [Xanthomonadaceae bacterium]